MVSTTGLVGEYLYCDGTSEHIDAVNNWCGKLVRAICSPDSGFAGTPDELLWLVDQINDIERATSDARDYGSDDRTPLLREHSCPLATMRIITDECASTVQVVRCTLYRLWEMLHWFDSYCVIDRALDDIREWIRVLGSTHHVPRRGVV